MKVRRVGHVSVNVEGNLEETRRFYTEVLGLGDAERPDLGIDGHWHTMGDAQLHLIDAPPLGEGIDPIGPHFCVEVDDLDAAIDELTARGIEHFAIGEGASRQVFVADPAGNTVELQQARD